MKKIQLIFLLLVTVLSCSKTEKSWQLSKSIKIAGINPIGITYQNGIWLSDGDHNRVVKIDDLGNVTQSIDSLERPMHISSTEDNIYIPQYGNDMILNWSEQNSSDLVLKDSLDAPAGVWVNNDEMAIADFYNHRILYSNNGTDWISFGKEGKGEGDFYYPTDVQITSHNIYVADAYNNRIQVFDKSGKFVKAIGMDQKMNAATGIFVSKDNLFSTDFENDRVMIFDNDGNLVQELTENIEKPTDLLVEDGRLYVINYRNSLVNIFEYKENLGDL
ncbi:NHL repeat-containing protein [Flavobacteriaceae bacterium MAR_2010_188]|nr:NHL repeat-containing protein [Flavobacteriaceae bacterium MAR_2010_188]